MSNFTSLFATAYNMGLGHGSDGACHLMQLRMSDLLPVDVEAGRIPSDDDVNIYNYGTHTAFSVSSGGTVLAHEQTCYTFNDLVQLLHSVYVTTHVETTPIEEDEQLEEQLEAIRQAALRADVIESDDEDDAFEDDEQIENIDMDDDDDDSEESDDDEPVYVTISKPSSKAGTKKYKKDIAAVSAVLQEYFDEEFAANGIDTESLIDVLEAVFDEVAELDIDTGVSFFEQVNDYVELE